jgi:hypothetical protein
MLTALAAAAEAEPSKMPFYVAGAATAAWAVIVALIGISRPAFPRHRPGMLAVCAVTCALVAATMVSAVVTS